MCLCVRVMCLCVRGHMIVVIRLCVGGRFSVLWVMCLCISGHVFVC